MGRKDITKYLSDLLEKHLNPSNDTRIYIYQKKLALTVTVENIR